MPPKKTVNVPQAKITEFASVTGCSDKAIAEELLSRHKLNVNNAVSDYYEGNYTKTAASPIVPTAVLEELFDKYKDQADKMGQEGITNFFTAANIELDDVFIFFFSFECKATVMGEFKKEEFIKGLGALGVKTPEELTAKKATLRNKYKTTSPEFSEFYKWVFPFSAGSKKTMPAPEAAMLLGMVTQNGYPLVAKLQDYLENHPQGQKEVIYKDTWTMFGHLLRKTKENGDGYDPNEAWPLLVVNFMETIVPKNK